MKNPVLSAPTEPDAHDDEDDHGPGEEELITTLAITLTPSSGGPAYTVRFRDLDGEGGNAPVVDRIEIDAGTNYDCTVQVLNETESPPENITEEVEEEAEAHQFFFETPSEDSRRPPLPMRTRNPIT